MCVHSHQLDNFDYAYRSIINPMLESIANGPGLTKRIKHIFDKLLDSLYHRQDFMSQWTMNESKDLHFMFLSRFTPLTSNLPITQETEQQGSSNDQEVFGTYCVRSIFCKCMDHTSKIQRVMVNGIVRLNEDGTYSQTTRIFGCPWYIIVVLSWIMGTAFNGRVGDYLSTYESMLLEHKEPNNLTPEKVKELRFAAILYHLGIEDLFYMSQRGQILPELIQPNYCLELPAGISTALFYTALQTVFGFTCTADKGWDQATPDQLPNTTFETLTTFKRRIVANDRHGAFEDFLGYINDLTGPRGFLDHHGQETDKKMAWMGSFILQRPGYFPARNTHYLYPAASISKLFDIERNPLTMPVAEEAAFCRQEAADYAAKTAATGVVPVPMAAALEAAWMAEDSVSDSVPSVAPSIMSSYSSLPSPSYSPPSTDSSSEWSSSEDADSPVPSPAPFITSHSFETPAATPLGFDALDFEPDNDDFANGFEDELVLQPDLNEEMEEN